MSNPAPRLLGRRFALTALLKSGQEVETHLGVDRTTGEAVVVKLVAAEDVPLAVRLRLRHEAEVLTRVEPSSHRAVVALGEDGDRLYVVQPFVPGITLEERLRRGPLTPLEALRLAADILQALDAAHAHGVVHRDVKPANVIVNADDLLERAVLIDFGYARSGGLDASVRDIPVGTVRYLAPEAAGLLDAVVDERSDLYSLGIVLFESLAGRPPFEGRDVGEVLRLHVSAAPPPLRGPGVAVPRALEALVARLLAKDPADRYQSAGAVLADVEELTLALEAGIGEPGVVIGRHDRRRSLAEPAFVGRAAELAGLERLLDAARRGAGGLAVVEAESGGGKTRLLDELAHRAARSGAWVLRGHGVDQAAQRPFELLGGVAEAVAAAAGEDPARAAALRERVGDRSAAAASAVPVLAPVLGAEEQPDTGPEAYGEVRSLEALACVLDALGSVDRPALVLLDDCQWADRLAVKLLGHWHDRARRSGTHVLVVAAYRSEEVPASHPLRATGTAAVSLGPLAALEVRLLGQSMAGPLPDEAVSVMARLSEGSPFMATAVLRGLVESAALRPGERGWEVDPAALAGVSTSRRAALFLVRRLELLAAPTLRLLSVGAVLGKEFDLELAVQLAGQPAGEAARAVAEARRRRIIWVEEHAGRGVFVHDKLREAVLARLTPDERGRLHLAAAEAVETARPDRVFELAYHFHAGGASRRAVPYAFAAAGQARVRHALELAETHYRMAAEGAADSDAARRAAEGLGDVITLQGRYDEAAAWVRAASDHAETDRQRAVLDGKLGDIAFKQGNQRQARECLERGLRLLGRRVPRRRAGFLAAATFEVVVQALHTLLPALFVHRRSLARAEADFLAVRLYSRLAYVYWFHSGKVPCAWAHLREMNLAERYPPTAELAQAYSEHAPVCTMVPWYRRGIAYAERSLAIRRELGDRWGEGQSMSFYGVVLYAASRYRDCIARCQEAIRLLERTGDRWEANTATWHVAFSLYRLGELAEAVELCRQLHATADAIGDQAAAGISLSGWSRASGGRVPADLVGAELNRHNEDAHTASEVHVAEAVRLLGAHRPDEAVAVLEAAAAIVRRDGLRQEYVAPLPAWLATARRMQTEARSGYDPKGRRAALRKARAAARRARRLARRFANNAPHALREQGLADALAGRTRMARRRLDQSLAAAERAGARYEAALTRHARARLAAGLGRPGSDAALRQAEEALAAFHEVDQASALGGGMTRLSLAERFDTLLAAGRRVASASSTERIYTAVRQTAAELLRGERCHVVTVGTELGACPTTASGERVDEFSRSLVERAVAAGTPVVSGDDGVDAGESLVLSGARSVLCAPIHCDGRPVACFYVVHEHVGGLFDHDDIQLAEFLATLAGAALEHVAGSEARFRSLAQHSNDVISIIGRDGRITYQSSSVSQVFSYAEGELIDRPLAEWLHPDDSPTVLASLAESLAGEGASTLLEHRVRRRDGSWCHVESTINNLVDDPSVRGLVLNTRDITERKALEEELRNRAWHDPLTGLANRSLFTDRLQHALARARRQGTPLAVLFLDLDDFKAINDTLGHPAGDALLSQVADRLRRDVRPEDTVARFGGDEFALLLEDPGPGGAEQVAARVMERFAEPFFVSGRELAVHASLGIAFAQVDPASGDTDQASAEEVLANADAAMYRAKARGKSRFEIFQRAMRTAAVERSSLKTDLELAPRRDEFVVHYQPVVRLADGVVSGFEALVRWNHPTRGLLLPERFIPLAEETGLVQLLGAWVLRQACGQARELTRRAGRPMEMGVNVSARQLQHPGLVSEITAALEESGLDPSQLFLEITESATVTDAEATIRKLCQLKDLGVRLAIDDFGTGYSSLSYLRRFPVDRLKVDRSFVAGLTTDPEDRAIVTSVIALAHAFGLEALAEGAETVHHAEELAGLGCDLAQGYAWARPEPAGVLGRWFASPGVTDRPVRVLVADDQGELRAAISLALNLTGSFEVVAEAADGAAAVEAARRLQPELVLLDVIMPGTDGLAALPGIRAAAPAARVVLLSAADPADIPAAAVAGTAAQLDKALHFDQLVERLSALTAV